MEEQVSEVSPVDGQDIREVGRVDRPGVPFGHPRLEGVHPDRHPHSSDPSDVPLIDQVTNVAGTRGGETALQPDDVPDSFRLGQSQDFLGIGGAGRQREC